MNKNHPDGGQPCGQRCPAYAHMGMLAPTMGLDSKRSTAWCEYGFKEDIIQSEKKDESRKETLWEVKSKTVFTHRFWRAFVDADLRRLVRHYAGILVRIRDDKDWHLSVKKGRGLATISER